MIIRQQLESVQSLKVEAWQLKSRVQSLTEEVHVLEARKKVLQSKNDDDDKPSSKRRRTSVRDLTARKHHPLTLAL